MVNFVITPITQAVTEGGTLRFRISIENPNYAGIGSYGIYWRTNATADQAANSSDYAIVSALQHLTFTASGPQSYEFTIRTNTDSRVEGTEFFSVDLYDYQQNWLGEEVVFRINDAVAELQIDELRPINATVVAGEDARITTVIRNVGNTSAGAFDTRIYLSRDQFVSSDDTVLRTFSSNSLNPNGTVTLDDTSVDFDHGLGLIPGNYFLLVHTDYQNEVVEANNSNNVYARPITIVAAPPTLSIAAVSADRDEGNSGTTAFTFTVTRGGATTSAASVNWSIGNNQSPATDGNDFASSTSGTLNWAANETGARTITIQVRGDTLFEGAGLAELFQVNLTGAVGATITQGSATGSIRNDDASAGATLAISAASADRSEGDSGLTSFTFTVTRSGDTSGATSVNWTRGDGQNPSASSNDFAGASSGTLTWAAGDNTTRTITISVVGDTAYESAGVAENFIVSLQNAVGSTITTSIATGRIRDDDAVSSTANTLGADSLNIAVSGGVDFAEIVSLARANVGRLWGPYDCTDFVWAITNLAGAPFFDMRGSANLFDPGDLLRPRDHGYIVPHSAQYVAANGISHTGVDEENDQWELVQIPTAYLDPSSEAGVALSENELRRILQPGDVVRAYTDNSQSTGHSFVVTGRTTGSGAPVISVVDNVDNITGNTDNRLTEHELFEFSFIRDYLADAGNVYIFRLRGNWDLSGDASNNVLVGGAGDDTLSGGPGDDVLIGGDGNDHVAAEGGADTIIGGAGGGDDEYDGGTDVDTVVFTSARENLLINLDAGFASGAEIGVDQLLEIENVIGGDGDDRIVGGAGSNVLSGGAGNDSIYGYLEDFLTSAGFIDAPDRLEGGDGADTLRGSGGMDVLIGGEGDDTLGGRGGQDVLDGGPGDDIGLITRIHLSSDYTFDFSAGSGGDITEPEGARFVSVERLQFVGGTGRETVTGGASVDLLDGREGNDVLNGGGGGDYVLGGAGDDLLFGGADHDWIETNTGNDIVDGGSGFDFASLDYRDRAAGLVFALAAADTVSVARVGGADAGSVTGIEQVEIFGTPFADDMSGGDESDWFEGGGANDILNGRDGNDFLFGQDGDDLLSGGAGRDNLSGGDGNDTILWDAADGLAGAQGGLGYDTFVFSAGSAPVTFQLGAHGFEQAEGRFEVTGARYVDVYTTGWQISSERGWANDGTSWFIDFDETGAAPYQRIDQAFDVNGMLAHEHGFADNGSTWDVFFDTDGSHPYVSLLQVRTANGVFANEHGVSDNGSTWDTYFDVDGTNPFVWVQQVRDANGVLAQETGLADTGTSWFTDWDETGTADFQNYQNVYDTEGRLAQQEGRYDNNHTWMIDYDETNAFAWYSTRYDYDENGVLIGTTVTPDGP